MQNSTKRECYVVLNRYRNNGRWLEVGKDVFLLPAEAQGPLSLGNIEKCSKAKEGDRKP